jgi:hypothetical protein
MQRAEISTETNQAQFSLISGMAAFIGYCHIKIGIIIPNRLRPRDLIHRIRTAKQ